MIKAKKEDTVQVSYTGCLSDGTIFDKSPEDRPLLFIVGRKEVITGFDEAVEGMYQGESKTVTIPCDKAYGEIKPELIEKIDRGLIGPEIELQIGVQLEITGHDDSKLCVMVREINEEQITLDANHPLAGKDLTFEIKLCEVKGDQNLPITPATS